jgi:hypothetical protein
VFRQCALQPVSNYMLNRKRIQVVELTLDAVSGAHPEVPPVRGQTPPWTTAVRLMGRLLLAASNLLQVAWNGDLGPLQQISACGSPKSSPASRSVHHRRLFAFQRPP